MYASQENDSDISRIAARYEEAIRNGTSIFLDAIEWIELMEYYMGEMIYDMATSAARDAGETYPDNTELNITRGEVYIYTSSMETARPIVESLVERYPTKPAVKVLHGMYLSASGLHHRSIEQFLSAYNEYEDPHRLNILLAEEYTSTGNYIMAIRYYQKAVLLAPEEPHLIDTLVDIYRINESYTLASHFFERLTEKQPYNAKLWYHLGFFLSRIEKYEDALKSLEYATYIEPTWSLPYYDMAEILWEKERYEDIISLFTRLSSYISIEDPYPYSMMGKCYHQIGQIELSCENFLRAIHFDPLNAEGWYNLSLAHFTTGHKRQALTYIYEGIECDPADIECLRLAWEIEESLHMWDEAESHLEEIINHSDSNQEDYMDYAYFLYERGKYNDSLEILKTLRLLHDNCHEAFYHMSSVYYALGDYEKGNNMLKKALSLAPELLHVMQDNYPELIENIPQLKHHIHRVDNQKGN